MILEKLLLRIIKRSRVKQSVVSQCQTNEKKKNITSYAFHSLIASSPIKQYHKNRCHNHESSVQTAVRSWRNNSVPWVQAAVLALHPTPHPQSIQGQSVFFNWENVFCGHHFHFHEYIWVKRRVGGSQLQNRFVVLFSHEYKCVNSCNFSLSRGESGVSPWI